MAVVRSLPVVLAAALAALVARDAWHVAREGGGRRARLDDAFAPLVASARGESRVGFLVPDVPWGEWLTRRVQAQYAFAPATLVTGVAHVRLVLARTPRPEALEEVARTNGLRVLARGDDGYALLERR